MLRAFLLVSSLVIGLVSMEARAVEDKKTSTFVLCKNQKTVRTLRIYDGDKKDEQCQVTYSKGATEQVVGSNRSVTTCKSILKNIQQNLEASKWSCRNVKSAKVTSSSEASVQ